MTNNQIPLREKKFAKTKVMIAYELIEQLRTKRFEEVSIADICKKVEISEGTFYNYFPHKLEALVYFLALNSLRWQWEVARRATDTSPLTKINIFFDVIAEPFLQPHFIYELLGALVGEKYRDERIPLSATEKQTAFPDLPGIEQYDHLAPWDFFKDRIVEAQDAGELSKEHSAEDVAIMVHSILCGSTLAIPEGKFADLTRYMKQQLAFLWKGLNAR